MMRPYPVAVRRVPHLLLALVLLLTALVLPNVPSLAAPDDTFADDFQTDDFTGSTGTLAWSGPWAEQGEFDGEAAGLIQVDNEGKCADDICLVLGKAAGPDAAVDRRVDLSLAATASLTFEYEVHKHGGGTGQAHLTVSDDGGGSWAPLDSWALGVDVGPATASYDLSTYLASDTLIKFSVLGSTDDSHLNVDNLAIEVAYWVQQTTPTGDDLFAVQFPVDDQVGYAAGDTGIILKTIDGGTHWIEQSTPTINSIRDIEFPTDVLTGYAVGAGDTILKTTNGTDWVTQTTPSGVDLRGMDFIDNLTGYAVGDGGTVLKTIDGGANWVQQPTSTTESLRDVAFPVDDQTGYASGTNGTILKTIDGGDSWLPQVAGISENIGAIQFPVDAANGYAVARGGVLLATTNGGGLWQAQATPTTGALRALHFPQDAQHGHVSSELGDVIATDSSGASWAIEPVPTNEQLLGIWFTSLTRGWVVGGGGVILATGNGGAAPAANQQPTFDQNQLDRTDSEGALVSITSPATDPDLDTLVYTATGLPEGVSIDAATGTITGALSANSSGTHSVTITVSDDGSPSLQDTDLFTWSVLPGEVTYLIANSGGGNGGDDLLTVVDRSDANPATNEVSIGTGTGTTGIEAAALQPGSDVLFAVERDQLGTVNVTTGEFTPLPSIAGAGSGSAGLIAFDNIEGLAFDPFSGELHATHRRGDYQADLLFKLDPATGAHTPGAFGGNDYVAIQNQGPYWHAADIAFDPTDGQLYLVHWTFLNQWSIATIDPATGSTTTIGPAPANLVSLAFDETGRLYSSTEQGLETLYELNKGNTAQISAIVIDNASDYEAMAIAFPVAANQPPGFDQNLTDRTDSEGAAISLPAAASDPDTGDSLSYAAAGLPPGLTIDPTTGMIDGTIGFATTGTYAAEVTVTDSGIPNLKVTDTFTWTVVEYNQPPVFDQDLLDQSDPEGAVISISGAASDPDLGDTLTYGAAGLPSGLGIDTASGLISGTIDFSTAAAASPYAVTVTVTDNGVPTASAVPDTFTWSVADTNQPPSVINPGAQTTPELGPFTLGLSASDPDGTVPSFSDGGTLPAWAALTDNGDGTATIGGMPGAGASGTSTITITVSDGGVPDLNDTAVFDLTVTNTNLPPTISNPGNQTSGEGLPVTIAITGSDPDGTTVSFTDSGTLPTWATITDHGDDTATISGTPGYTDAATTSVTITVTDGSLTADAVFDLIITNTNRTPVVNPITDQSVAENSPFSLLVSATDPDGTTPAITAPALPSWATITDHGDGTATIAGTPGFGDTATTTVTVIAFDGSLPGTSSFALTVTDTNQAPVANPVADASAAEGSALTPIVVTASDPDGTTPSLAATALPSWATFVDNGDGTATITGTPGYTDAAITTITITVEDGGIPNLSDSTTFDLTVANTNRAPFVAPLADQTVGEGTPFTLVATAADPDGSTPSLSAAGLPDWASLVDNADGTATISGTPGSGDAAISTATVTASDGTLTGDTVFQLTVTDVNQPPVFDADLPNRGDGEGTAISLLAAATDPDLDNISYTATGLPPGLAIDPGTGLISGTVATTAEAGSPYAVILTATDSGAPNLTATDTFTWTITNTNQSPLFTQDLGDRADAEGAVISLSAGATDPDLDVLAYAAVGLPPGLGISPTTGLVSGTISLSSVGSYDVTITVADSGTPVLTATDTFTWVVTNTNQPPLLTPIGDQLGPEEIAMSFTATATDPDGDDTMFALAGAPVGAVIDPTTGLFTWTPTEADGLGSHTVTVIATDDGLPQLTDSQVVTITVTESNLPPTLDPIANQASNEGSVISLVVTASDRDLPTNHLGFSAVGLPPGLSINADNGLISGVVAAETVGVYAVTIAVTDNAEPPFLATTGFQWAITDTNKAPSLGLIHDQFGDELATISFTATATDADGDNLTFSLTGGPAGAGIGATSGVFTWTPDELDGPGTFSAIVLVTDDGIPALGDSQVVAITVAEANLPPTIDDIDNQSGNAGDEVELTISATDPDLPASELTYSATGLPPGLFLNPTTGLISGTLQATESTAYAVELTVTDHGTPGLSATASFGWTVDPASDGPDPELAPTINEIGNQFTDEGSTVSLAVVAASTGTITYSASGLPPGLSVNASTGLISGAVSSEAIGAHAVIVTVTDNATPAQQAHTLFTWTITDVAAAVQKEDLVQALDDFAAEIVATSGTEAEPELVRRSLVVMGSAAAATTESLRWPFALLAALLVGFATVGRVGLYPLLWRGDRQTGTITLYDPELHFGLIESDEGGEAVHVHANAFPRRMRPILQVGIRVRYRVLASDNRSSAWGATADE